MTVRSCVRPVGLLVLWLGLACFGTENAIEGARLGSTRSEPATLDWEWKHYLGDAGRSHASPLRQINRKNVHRLEVAWSYDTGPVKSALSQIQCNPIIVGGVLFGTTSRSQIFALDAATGREIWRFDPEANGSRAQGHNRGVVFWEGREGGRIVMAAGQDLWSLDAGTGEPDPNFGAGGRVDLRSGLAHGTDGGDVTSPTPGVVFEDMIILGTKVGETAGSAPGDIRAYDLNTGAVQWIFNPIPRPGEVGSESWPEEAWRTHGGANSWAGATLDRERGIAFFPTGSATPDFWGGDRAGENLFANSLLALDARTGQRLWHFQFVHHDLWDRDLPAPPTLVRFEHEGKIVDAVAQPTKSGHLFVFDRASGTPIFPIEEQPVHASIVEGEWVAPTQPIPSAPPPFTRQHVELDDGAGRDPSWQRVAADLSSFRMGDNFIPPSLEGSVMYPAFDGGAEWGGAAWDAEAGLLYVNANEVGAMLRLMERGPGQNPRNVYLEKCGVCHAPDLAGTGVGPSLIGIAERRTPVDIYTSIALGGGRMPGFLDMDFPTMERVTAYLMDPENIETALAALDARAGSSSKYVSAGYVYLRDDLGVPINRPPWGTLTAIDLARGELRWQIPLGEYPQMAEQGLVDTGSENYGGPVVTAGGLLFIAATADGKFRAFDKATGEELWETELPAAGYATPSTYSVAGRQYVVIAAGGGKLGTPAGSKYVAFALPTDSVGTR